MAENAFLTDRRREFLSGDYDLDDSADRHLKRRTENGATLALDELIEVARSPHVDNSDVFDPGLIEQLIVALYTGDGFEPFRTFEGDRAQYSEHIAYQLGLHARLSRLNNEFSQLAHGDPDMETGLIPPEGYDGLNE